MAKLLSVICGPIGSGKPPASTSNSIVRSRGVSLACRPSGPYTSALAIAPLALSRTSALRPLGSVAGPGSSRFLTTMRETLKLFARTVANSASPIASCGSFRPFTSMVLNSLLSPKIPNGEPEALMSARRASPARTSLNRTSGRPLKSQRLAEPIFTGRPRASDARRS